jgi:hypothetical protein
MATNDHTHLFSFPGAPTRDQQGLLEGIFCCLYVAGCTALRDFFQAMGVTGYKCGLSSRRDVLERIRDLRARRYGAILAPLDHRDDEILDHPHGDEWFLSELPDPCLDPEAAKILSSIPFAAYRDGIITFRLPEGKSLVEVERKFQQLLAGRDLNRYLETQDGRERLIEAGMPANARLFTDYLLLGDRRRSLASEIVLVRPRRELAMLLQALRLALK